MASFPFYFFLNGCDECIATIQHLVKKFITQYIAQYITQYITQYVAQHLVQTFITQYIAQYLVKVLWLNILCNSIFGRKIDIFWRFCIVAMFLAKSIFFLSFL